MISEFNGQYDWASNFYFKAPFYVRGQMFKTNEHYFAAHKTTDPEWYAKIINAVTAAEAKKFGKQCPIQSNWNTTIRAWVMANGLFHKYSQNSDILTKLLATGAQPMTEGNWWHDNFWGDCHCNNKNGRHPECLHPGKNALGLLTMNLRTYYQTVQAIQGI